MSTEPTTSPPIPNVFGHEGDALAAFEASVLGAYETIKHAVPPECTPADVAYAVRLGSLIEVANESTKRPSRVVRRMVQSDLGTPLGLVLLLRRLGGDPSGEGALEDFASTLVGTIVRAESKTTAKWKR